MKRVMRHLGQACIGVAMACGEGSRWRGEDEVETMG